MSLQINEEVWVVEVLILLLGETGEVQPMVNQLVLKVGLHQIMVNDEEKY